MYLKKRRSLSLSKGRRAASFGQLFVSKEFVGLRFARLKDYGSRVLGFGFKDFHQSFVQSSSPHVPLLHFHCFSFRMQVPGRSSL